ncbi:hypothetical protein CY652_03290 [Burkholderia sp. WAC0059]|uniref:hypothetical protein n=1 Tax=Burkholderia sp. WAC0059 TaxID=2066022 RepID=UPI000C7EB98B|nr:hypothetical protein [Burkholderia sp. WAC0059]PLZ04005.1 hypothetical protein CY652_03290 [Burkholderia sp. WAC0059]
MQQATRRRPGRSETIVALICAALITITLAVSYMKHWSRSPADAGICPGNSAQWRQSALQGKIDGTDAPAFRSKSFVVQPGVHWDDDSRRWVVPFRTPDQPAGDRNFTALIDCNGSVYATGGGKP